ncbi:beta-glucosidase 4 isoform X1 [Selaginella moellendorffii]|nr:beta-glucosidase 4 isoform X1 [Selaginella moellendorffii]|eukprot:XP_024540820.1 beta-glucosidase 4 isoform X1 [Selaginella moellendorffii]
MVVSTHQARSLLKLVPSSIASRVPTFRAVILLAVVLPLTALVAFQIAAYAVMPSPPEQDFATNSAGAARLPIQRRDFPHRFVFGTATASYQVEGAFDEGGRGLSIWDTFCKTPGRILDASNGDLAVDQYHRYKEDVDNMAEMGVDAYRFSVAWARIYPDGLEKGVNKEGVTYYNKLIDYLLEKGIKPYVTLYHWDLPQKLHDSFGGWTSQEIVKHFAAYAETCFAAFGDRVKHWITFNEPLQFSVLGYGLGIHAPGRCSDRRYCKAGDSATEPYLAGHNVILSHAAAVKIYREKFKALQGGVVGITVDAEWAEPMTDSVDDKVASQRRLEFQLGWFLDPFFFGDYPATMREYVGDRLPKFTPEEQKSVRGSVEFVGINHYSSRFVTPALYAKPSDNYHQDQRILTSAVRNGAVIGDKAASPWLYIVPWGLHRVLKWVSERYNRPPIYVTENGMDEENNSTLTLDEQLDDLKRIHFYQDYLTAVLQATREGMDIRGYFAWSLVDNFEWAMGYTKRFGLYYVDYETLKRYPKRSARWFKRFLSNSIKQEV